MADPQSIAEEEAQNLREAAERLARLLVETPLGPEDGPPDDARMGLTAAIFRMLSQELSAYSDITKTLLTESNTSGLFKWAATMGWYVQVDDPTKLVTSDVFLDTHDEDAVEGFKVALSDLLTEVGADTLYADVEEWGSWRKRFVLYLRDKEALDNIAGALETAALRVPQSQANSNNANALAVLVDSLAPVPNAAIRLGSLLFIKVTRSPDRAQVLSTDLSERQMQALERNPGWLTEPQMLLVRLQSVTPPGEPPLQAKVIELPSAPL